MTTANRSRPHQIITRLSDDEFEIYHDKLTKSNMSQNSFCLKCILDKPVIQKTYDEIQALVGIQKQLASIGNNLNQLSKHCHQNNSAPELIVLQNLKQELENSWQLLKRVKEGKV